MARAFTILLLFHIIVNVEGTLECSSLQPTNITCANLKSATPQLRAYCKGTRLDNAFWVSSQQPIANALPREYKDDVHFFQNTFAHLNYLVKKKRHERYLRPTCNREYGVLEDGSTDRNWYNVQRKWRYSAIAHQKRIGLSKPNSNCFTQIQLNNSYSGLLIARMRNLNNAFEDMAKILVNSARKKVDKNANLFDRQIGCWKHVISPMFALTTTSALQCSVMHVVGFRRVPAGKFNLGVSLTNAPIKEARSEKQRHYLSETWTYDENNDSVRAVPIPSYVRGNLNGLRNDTTTALFTWGGNVKISYFLNIPTAEGPAMRLIDQATSHLQDNIHDGIALSNIAILLFPALFAMIPISSFELPSLEHKLNKVVAYSAVTDVIAVLPLFIKGVEMLVLAQRKHTRCIAWTVGVEGDGLGIIELWCANCVHHAFFQKYGVAFIIVAFVFMITGVAFEILAFKWVNRERRKMKLSTSSKWWERAGITDDVCSEYECCGFDCDGTATTTTSTASNSIFTINTSRFDYFSSRRDISRRMYHIDNL